MQKKTDIMARINQVKQEMAELGPMRPGSLSKQKLAWGKTYWHLSYYHREHGHPAYVSEERVDTVLKKSPITNAFRIYAKDWWTTRWNWLNWPMPKQSHNGRELGALKLVMPNHFHAILEIVWAPLVVAQNMGVPDENQMGQPQGIGLTIGAFQSIVTVKYIRGVKMEKWTPFNKKLWQRNYWEHIISDESELIRICRYIKNNSQSWRNDALGGEKGNVVREQSAEYGKKPGWFNAKIPTVNLPISGPLY